MWRPARILGHGGVPLTEAELAASDRAHGLPAGEVLLAWMPFAVLVVVVAAWTGPWSSLPGVGWYAAQVTATAPETRHDHRRRVQVRTLGRRQRRSSRPG